MKVAVIIQARMGSTRLSGKVLRDLAGEPMLARVVARLARASEVDEVIVATSTLPGDEPIAALCAKRAWRCFRGSEDDVLDRYFQAAHAAGADAVVRITADCPLIDPAVVDQVVRAFREQQPALDYACNFHPRRTFPRGLDVEILRRDVLERCHREAADPASREHVTAFIYGHPERFQIHGVMNERDESTHRWTVDTPEDFALAETIYRHFGHDHFTWREALAALAQHPGWSALNRHVAQKAH